MSSLGYRRAELEAIERERLRVDQVRRECSALLDACNDEMAAIRDAAVQQLTAPALREVRKALTEARGQLGSAPDAAIAAARTAQRSLHTAVAQGEASARRWSEEQRHAQEALAAARLDARVMRSVAGNSGAASLEEADSAIAEAEKLIAQGKNAAADQVINRAGERIEAGRQAALDESVRKAVVSSLLTTLREQGFQVEKPQLFAGEQPGGHVILVGHLPSGRRARFDVFLDGKLGFDMDGYEGRACARDLESVEETLRTKFRIQLGPPQITWKNPDKISKGARDLPTGGVTRGKKG